MNILISSLGLKIEIIEETIGLFNYCQYDFYKDKHNHDAISEVRSQYNLTSHSVDEVWLVATDQKSEMKAGRTYPSTIDNFETIQRKEQLYGVKFKLFLLDGIHDIINVNDARYYHDLALKVVAFAQSEKGENGKVYVSLACGRKTMSTDMLDAVNCFGCDLLFHILGDNPDDALPFSLGTVAKNQAIEEHFVFQNIDCVNRCLPDLTILEKVEKQKSDSQHFFTSYFLKNDDRNNFHVLYTLSKEEINRLKNERIGVDKNNEQEDLNFLHNLPKTELHCHLGGVLSPGEMIEVAKCYKNEIDACCEENKEYSSWLKSLCLSNKNNQENWKVWYNNLAKELHVSKGLIVAPFLLLYDGKCDELERMIYGEYQRELDFTDIGIRKYEALGDLQGSALLCNEHALRKTVDIIIEKCKKENVLYLELRCSPLNYVQSGFSAKKVMTTILDEIDKAEGIEISIILITSRHSDEVKIRESIQFANDMMYDKLFQKYFRGFDLAGAEGARQAKDVRNMFLDAMRECHSITIHAGETEAVESVWQAVYELNAERIGHGLSLIDNKDLMKKFLDRSIGIEMCPSSNYQIVGFKDNYYKQETSYLKDYPLKKYLENELKVSINTDDPGISLTNITKELLKAARLTNGGLSKWEIMQLLCNGFKSVFYPYKEKKALMAKAEGFVFDFIKTNKL